MIKHITQASPEQWQDWQDRVEQARTAFRKQVTILANEIQDAKTTRAGP